MGKVVRAQNGKVAVYTTSTPANPSLGPLNSPLSNLGVLSFHSDLFYPRIVQTFTGTATIPAVSSVDILEAVIATHAHGLADAPLTIATATATVNGTSRTFCLNGTAIIREEAATAWSPAFLTVTSDATNVYLQVFRQNGNLSASTPAQSISYTIRVLDLLATQTTAPDGELGAPDLELTPTRITMGRRKFDTDLSYIVKATSGTEDLITGKTINVSGAPATPNASTPTPFYFGTTNVSCRLTPLEINVATFSTVTSYPSPTFQKIRVL